MGNGERSALSWTSCSQWNSCKSGCGEKGVGSWMSCICDGVGVPMTVPCGVSVWMDIASCCSGMIESRMHVSNSYWSFCHIEVNGVILTCQSGSLACICDWRSVTCLCGCSYVGNIIYSWWQGVSYGDNFLWAVMGKVAKTVTVVALCIRGVMASMTFLATNKASVITWHHVHCRWWQE